MFVGSINSKIRNLIFTEKVLFRELFKFRLKNPFHIFRSAIAAT